ncbi:hypothetical protein MDOR_12230 [Mycolicibacterium doricum]|uniref:Uncharacterized protein n=1 Tax=Mycolicibacterium doricum TaxID=126673 RepID=A0A7I7VP37_9MYCO|nr:hypothetical protein MDOR_12230 [Mycolicibacterium doricum]
MQAERLGEPGLPIAPGIREQAVVVGDERVPGASVRQQPFQRRGAGPERRRPGQKGLLLGFLVFVEQNHQTRPAAEAAEQRALADSCGRVAKRSGALTVPTLAEPEFIGPESV